ncbi:glycosyltransferase family 39 protein [Actinomadura viridis]|uniref:glycosyltransferase family 39 protein n=1 Tax=Actinomadura viridis TaxID=58110 RepID=UPI003675E4CA
MGQTTVREPAGRDTTSRGGPKEAAGRLRARLARPRARVAWLSALVAACGVLAQWVTNPPPLYFDPYYVWLGARDWPDIPLDQWPFNEVPHQVTRLGLLLPARLAQEVLGPGQAAYFAVAAAGGALFFVGCYLAVRSLFGDLAGVAAALLLIVHPFFTLTNPYGVEVTWSAGVMLPDMPGAGLFAIGMAALVTASRRTGRAQTRLLLAAGVCFGSAFLVREFLAFLFLAIPAYLALLRIPWRRNVTVGAPMAAILAANLVHNAVVWGDPLAGLMSAATHGGQSRDHVTRLLALRSFVRAMGDWHPLGLIFVGALVLTVVGWAVTRDRRLALALVWFLTLGVPLTLLAGVIDPNDISLRAWLLRYWFAVLPALLAGGLGSLILLSRRIPEGFAARFRLRTVAAPALAAILAATYTVAVVRAVPSLPRDTAWNELRLHLRDHDRDLPVLWADRRLAQTLTFYTRSMWGDPVWHGRIRDFDHSSTTLPVESYGQPMLFTRWRGQESQILAGWRPSPQGGWKRMWRSSDGVLEIWGSVY